MDKLCLPVIRSTHQPNKEVDAQKTEHNLKIKTIHLICCPSRLQTKAYLYYFFNLKSVKPHIQIVTKKKKKNI